MMYFLVPDYFFINVYYFGHLIYLGAFILIFYLFIKSNCFPVFVEQAAEIFYKKNGSLISILFSHLLGMLSINALFVCVFASFNYIP